ncbi:hypothetical protein A4A49_09344 [Nicotiana attenuata]|uniref:Uncharacterized protein n=1 Tax=Nicotiana attenuata TaxID=49451 RepID=A0A1J6IR21_NICAT|nr:hypothetical protein A4A49_09344 [Nicotiana attenuata]
MMSNTNRKLTHFKQRFKQILSRMERKIRRKLLTFFGAVNRGWVKVCYLRPLLRNLERPSNSETSTTTPLLWLDKTNRG